MRCVTVSESQEWLREHGYPLPEQMAAHRVSSWFRKAFHQIPLAFPQDSGRKVRLATEVIDWAIAQADGEVLLLIEEWGVWPSSEHMSLFTRFREALGEPRLLIDAPGHVVSAADRDDAVSVLAVALLFFWDCHVFAAGMRPVFSCSHDEWCAFFTAPEQDRSAVTSAFANWMAPATT